MKKLILLLCPLWLSGQPRYDLLLQGGRVIDARNNISAIRDVAIKDGKIAAVAPRLNPADGSQSQTHRSSKSMPCLRNSARYSS